MDDDLRSRLKSKDIGSSGSGLFSIWDEQRRMQAEEDRINLELAQAKNKARELKKTLRKRKYDETGEIIRPFIPSSITILNKNIKKVYEATLSFIAKGRKTVKLSLVAVLILVGIVGYKQFNSSTSDTLGDSMTISSSAPASGIELPREDPVFSILYPVGRSPADYDVVRISPEGADASYTYLDRFTDDGTVFKVTQQGVPDNFDLAKTATDFQATSIIQLDEYVVYHGYSEKGRTQSLLFIKNEKLVTIRSPQKFTDDQWAAYIISLK